MQQQAIAAGQPASGQTGSRLDYAGTGGEMLGKLIVGAILTSITFGIYLPWFLIGFYKYSYSKTTMKTTEGKLLKAEFTGTGGQFFVLCFVNYLLCVVTLGIYWPWFMTKLIKYFNDNVTASDDAGNKWRLQYNGTGGGLFGVLFVGVLLTVVTFGIYTPWFICRMQKFLLSQTKILENGAEVGQLDFVGTGGDLFVTFLVGYLLCMVTFFIYAPWFQVKMMKFNMSHQRVTYKGRVFTGDFVGQGMDLFLINLVGMLLTMVTFGIYVFWFITNTIRFQTNNHVFREISSGQ